MEYYRVNSKGRQGRSLSSGGPPSSDTSGMRAANAQEAIKELRVLSKAAKGAQDFIWFKCHH
jgi:hypothetical protein